MDIIGIQNQLNAIKVDLLAKSPQAVVDAWKVGQLVNANAVSKSQNGQATINIGGALIAAQTQFPVTPGQPLQLEVSSLAAMTVLKIVTNTLANTPANILNPGVTGKPDTALPTTISLQALPALIKQLPVGLQLTARIQPPTDNQPTRAVLELAGTRIPVQLSQPLPTHIGPQVKLEVLNPGAIAALKILTPLPVPTSENVSQALRATLPKQAPLPPLLANLALIARASNSPILPNGPRLSPPLPQTVVELTRAIVEQLPRPETLTTAQGVKQAVAQSGLFLEAKLAQATQQPPLQQFMNPLAASIPTDFKGGLVGLLVTLLSLIKSPSSNPLTASTAQAIHPQTAHTPPLPAQNPTAAQATLNQSMNLQQALTELLKSVESGLARVQLNQLISSTPDDDGKRNWMMELPMRNGENIDLIQLHIEKEKQQQGEKETVLWAVTISLTPTGLGPVQARISFANNIINTSFWSENGQATDFIRDNLPILKRRYGEVGLTVGTLHAREGKAPTPTSADDYVHDTLLDEKA